MEAALTPLMALCFTSIPPTPSRRQPPQRLASPCANVARWDERRAPASTASAGSWSAIRPAYSQTAAMPELSPMAADPDSPLLCLFTRRLQFLLPGHEKIANINWMVKGVRGGSYLYHDCAQSLSEGR
jgi:hypothetical protein